jgi:glutamate N-acetyltransferase/amino-acid N-acetyltransferase
MSDEQQLQLSPVPGIRLGIAAAGIKSPGRNDVLLFEVDEGASCAAVYTRNAFCAAPVLVARQHQAQANPRYLLVNSGNANAGTGQQGLAAATACCRAVAELRQCRADEVLPFSTGVIGEPLPVDKIAAALPQACHSLSETAWADAARAIMTTDTRPKGASRQFVSDGVTITVTGIAKGSGMICPDMATMLAYIATDMPVAAGVLDECLHRAVAVSFNSITVDGDTSTNDACILLATGQARHAPVERLDSDAGLALEQAVTEICIELAQAIIRDGEGATKFITIDVRSGQSLDECRHVAYTVAHSPLVKTAFFAADPNWGRILAAVGRAGINDLDVSGVSIFLDEVCIVADGQRAADYTESAGAAVMRRTDITVHIELGRGDHAAQVWTTDLSYDYVRINAEYRS